MIKIEFALNIDKPEWDKYVHKHNSGSFCHLFGWHDAIVESCGHQPYYIKALDAQNSIVGLLPLFEVKSFLFGHTLVSTPFCMYGGILADSPEIYKIIETRAKELADKLQVDYLEIRSNHKQETDLIEKSAHSYFVKNLAVKPDDVLAQIKKKQRAVVRHSSNNELTQRIDKDVDTLYDIYSISVRNLGTPVFPKALFFELIKQFDSNADILTIEKDNTAISSVMNFYYQGTVMPYYGGGLAHARALKSNDFMYYQLMLHAVKKGCDKFDFGRSKNDSGPEKYKRSWGIEPTPIYHYYYLVKATEIPNLSPNNPKYQMMIKLWKKLPVSISRSLGPLLAKYLG